MKLSRWHKCQYLLFWIALVLVLQEGPECTGDSLNMWILLMQLFKRFWDSLDMWTLFTSMLLPFSAIFHLCQFLSQETKMHVSRGLPVTSTCTYYAFIMKCNVLLSSINFVLLFHFYNRNVSPNILWTCQNTIKTLF